MDQSYVRCLTVLMAGAGYPMVATHDPRLIAIAADLAGRHDRKPDTYEYQMLYGIRPNEQRRLVGLGQDGAGLHAVRDGLVRLLHAPAGRATRERGVLPALAGDPVVSRLAVLGAGKIGEALLSGHAARRAARRATWSSWCGGRSGASSWRSGTACGRCPRPRRPAADVLLVTVKPQDIDALVDELAPHVSPRDAGGLAGGRHPDRVLREAAGPGTPVVRVMSNTPVLVDEAMSAISAGLARGRAAPAAGRGAAVPGRQGDPGAGGAAGRGDRAVRQRPGVLLLPGRGDDRRRHPARAARGRSPPT